MNFNKLYSGVIYDTLHTDFKYDKPFVLSSKIKPVWDFRTIIFGKAFTCKGKLVRHARFIDDNIRLQMLSNIPKDSIMVYDTDCYYGVAHFGDITATIAKKSGCVGAVIDGCTRDVEAIENINFPVFCRGIIPIDSYGYWQVTDYNVGISILGINGSVIVTPNDYIFGDRDGVLVIPGDIIQSVYKKATERMKREEKLRNKIKNSKRVNLVKAYKNTEIH